MHLVMHVFPSRVSDREAALDAALRLLQQFYLNLEKFFSWLTEAETTCNVLIDATNKERLQEQPAARNLLAQWKVGSSHTLLFIPVTQFVSFALGEHRLKVDALEISFAAKHGFNQSEMASACELKQTESINTKNRLNSVWHSCISKQC